MSGKSIMMYICNFHVLSNLLLIYICKLHWNRTLTVTSERCREIAESMHKVRWELDEHKDPFAAIKLIKTIQRDVYTLEGKFSSDLHIKFPCFK